MKIPASLLCTYSNRNSAIVPSAICSSVFHDLLMQVKDMPYFPSDPGSGILYFMEGKYADAIQIFEESLEWGLSVGSEDYMRRLIFDLKLWEVLCLFASESYKQALAALKPVYDQLGEFEALLPEDYMLACLCYSQNKGQYKKGHGCLKRALIKHSENDKLHLFAARWYFRFRKIEKAICHFRIVTTYAPNNIQCLTELACAHLLHEYDMASFNEVAERALAQVPLNTTDHYCLGLLH